MKPHVVIIGGGVTGLTAAFTLKQLASQENVALRCTVFEASSRLGGKILTHRERGFVMEGGPDSLLARKPEGTQLIRDLGIESEVVGSNTQSLKTYILHHGRLETMPPGTNMGIPAQIAPFASTKLLSPSGKARALMDLVLPKSTLEGDESLGHFLRRRLGDELVNNIVEPLLAGIYAGSVDELSLQATFPQFQTLESKYRSLILGSIAQRKNAPARTNTSGRSAFITLRGGLETLIERLYDNLQDFAELQTDTRVVALRKNSDGTYTVEVENQGETHAYPADAVILATPAFVTAQLLDPSLPEAGKLRQIHYVSTATVMLAYPKSRIDANLDASGFVIPRHENRAITACTWVSSKWPHTSPEDYVLIRCYVGRSGQTEALSLSDGDMASMVQGELKDILGIDAQPWFVKVTRWNDAMPQYGLNHIKVVKEVESALRQKLPGVLIAGAAYHGVGIPDCIAQGRLAGEKAYELTTTTAAPSGKASAPMVTS